MHLNSSSIQQVQNQQKQNRQSILTHMLSQQQAQVQVQAKDQNNNQFGDLIPVEFNHTYSHQQINKYLSTLQHSQLFPEVVRQSQQDPNYKQHVQKLYQIWCQARQQRQKIYPKMRDIIQGKFKGKHEIDDQNQVSKQNVKCCVVCKWREDDIGARRWKWCKACGKPCCQSCVGRYRMLKQNSISQSSRIYQKQIKFESPICQICDNQYIKAIIFCQDETKFKLLSLCIENLRQKENQDKYSESKTIKQQNILSKQKDKKYQNVAQSQTLQSIQQRTSKLKTANASIQYEIKEAKRKVAWGSHLTSQLQSKCQKLRREAKIKRYQSENYKPLNSYELTDDAMSYTGTQAQNIAIKPPRALKSEDDQDKLTQSATYSILEDETKLIRTKGNCCTVCAVM